MFNFKKFFVWVTTLVVFTGSTLSFNAFASDPIEKLELDLSLNSAFVPFDEFSRRELETKKDEPSVVERREDSFYRDTTLQSDPNFTASARISRQRRQGNQERKRKAEEAMVGKLHRYYYYAKQGKLSKLDLGRPDVTSPSSVVVSEVSDVKERFASYIEGTSKGKEKLRTFEAAGLNADGLDALIRNACAKGSYTIEERERTQYGTSYRMDIDVDERHFVRCGLFCDEKPVDESGLYIPTSSTDARDTTLGDLEELPSFTDYISIDSPIVDGPLTCKSGCQREEFIGCFSPPSSSQGSCSIAAASPIEVMGRKSPLSISESRPISPRLVTGVVMRRPSKYKKRNVVRLKEPLYYDETKTLKIGTYGVVLTPPDHSTYTILFVTPKAESYKCNKVDESILEFVDEFPRSYD